MKFACLYLPPSSLTKTRSREQAVVAHHGALLSLASEHSPRVEVHGTGLVLLDVDGLGQLWGPSRQIGERLRRAAAERQLGVRVAIAGTKMAALLATQGRCGLTVIPPGAEAERVSTFPLSVLKQLSYAQSSGPTASVRTLRQARSAKTVHAAEPASLAVSVLMLLPVVQRWGIKTLGELADLPTDELFTRLGQGGVELQRIARGQDSRPLVPEAEEERFEQTVVLEWPVERLEPLACVLGRVLDPLCGQLAARGVAVGMLHVRLTLVTRETHERSLRFPAAVGDPKVLRTLVLLDLESHPPSAGIDAVTISADPVPARTLQFSLLERAVPSAERVSTLLARLTVLMGEQRCGSPALVDTHEPGAFEMRPFVPRSQGPRSVGDIALVPMLRRFRTPVSARVTVEHGQPVRVSTGQWCRGFSGPGSGHGQEHVVTCAGPWRTSGQWWAVSHSSSAAASFWDRDEWDVALSDGGLYRMFRDRDSKRWFVEGMVD